jgi:hypothetical protein
VHVESIAKLELAKYGDASCKKSAS